MTPITITIDADTHKVVPIEPTDEMWDAGRNQLSAGEGCYDIYTAMISAAPEPEPATGKLSPAPCDKCGYNGPGYYQSDTHPCALTTAQDGGGE